MGNNGSFSSVTNFFLQCTAVFIYKDVQKCKIVFDIIIVSDYFIITLKEFRKCRSSYSFRICFD